MAHTIQYYRRIRFVPRHVLHYWAHQIVVGYTVTYLRLYKLCFSEFYIEVRPYVWPLGCRNEGCGAGRLSGAGGGGSIRAVELKEGGGWVVGVAVWVLNAVEGGTLVLGQRDTILDAQW